MCKHYNQDEQGYETICEALESMVEIARHINEMKRKHEAAIHVQEIQSQLHGMEVINNLFCSLGLVKAAKFWNSGIKCCSKKLAISYRNYFLSNIPLVT